MTEQTEIHTGRLVVYDPRIGAYVDPDFERPSLAMRAAAVVIIGGVVVAGTIALAVGFVLAAALAVVFAVGTALARIGLRARRDGTEADAATGDAPPAQRV